MSNVPTELKYTKSHEWVAIDGDTATVGITDHAQDLLGDMVFIELPEVGDSVEAGKECAVVESVKAASDVYSPLSGEVVEVNETLADSPETVNSDPYAGGWLYKVKMSNAAEVDAMLDAAAYSGVAAEDAH
ncbi:glycine cleavage system protein GcvH [Sulfuriflexus mobilis]|uniref:glycine cleavage system protein GcvH n=1 Tax=Sulfuriflexus mobilis TaxID=1811807 RepID=UPI000F83743A|nr:glycine cleavage system protein GcvH [Sulfuriflexus mobilis]